MPSLVIPTGVMLRLLWSKGGTRYAVNVLGASNAAATTIDQAFANTLGAAIKASFTSSGFAGRVSTDVTLDKVGVRNINVANQAEFLDSGLPVAGTDAADPLPASSSLVITLRTANAGPSYRGRVYLPGMTEASNDTDGVCLAAAGQDALDFINGIAGAVAANGLGFAVLSRPRAAGTIPAKTITAKLGFVTNVNNTELRDLVWDNQRRRATAGI